jgi:hypothetical protein
LRTNPKREGPRRRRPIFYAQKRLGNHFHSVGLLAFAHESGLFCRKGIPLNSSFPTETVPEFIAYAKEHPGQLSMASPARGSIMIHRHALQDRLTAILAIL